MDFIARKIDGFIYVSLDQVNKDIEEKNAEIENIKATHYAEMVDAGMRERKLKRALWLARAERAKTEHKSKWNFSTIYKDYIAKWKNVERKCRAKAELYR